MTPGAPPSYARGRKEQTVPVYAKRNPFARLSEEFPTPVHVSEIKMREGSRWICEGMVALGEITLLAALWKVGKTTMLAHMLRCFQSGEDFCGRKVEKTKVLYVTEESEHRWALRREKMGLGGDVYFLFRPFKGKPNVATWQRFLDHLVEIFRVEPFGLVVLDTISDLWCVNDENSAAEVHAALMPLRSISDQAAVILVHHFNKSGGSQGTGIRGSGALPAFCDFNVEMRRYRPNEIEDTRRVLTCTGRDDEAMGELVIDLTGDGYRSAGDKEEMSFQEFRTTAAGIIRSNPGCTHDHIRSQWPGDGVPARKRMLDDLLKGCIACYWRRDGDGKKGDPYRYYPVD